MSFRVPDTFLLDQPVEIRLGLLRLLADYAEVDPEELRPLLITLYLQPDAHSGSSDPEGRAAEWLLIAGLGPLLSVIDDWTPYLAMTPAEWEDLQTDEPLENVLPLIALPVGPVRRALLNRARAGHWRASALVEAVRATLLQQGIPPSLLAVIDRVTALIHGSARLRADRYETFRQQVFEIELADLDAETVERRLLHCLEAVEPQ
ncbi:hypothetical protein HLB42_21275 (plasmid) [Deinococcus sp. D7000]|nr:hypothetical protein HLB42_21275 [Deinococcus sp. D7000]